jgi:hypothetical protein
VQLCGRFIRSAVLKEAAHTADALLKLIVLKFIDGAMHHPQRSYTD